MINQQDAVARINELCDLTLIKGAGGTLGSEVEIDAIYGSPATESSFKSILGIGLLLLAREQNLLQDGQPVIESTSGSLGVGLAAAGKLLGHPVTLVTDKNIPIMTRNKIDLLGAELIIVETPDPIGGFQKAREDKVEEVRASREGLYWTRQNDSKLNPMVYEKYLIPALAQKINPKDYNAGIFCVGSGGHFSALSNFLLQGGIPSYVAERDGSVTFGHPPKSSTIRGSGNQHGVPGVIQGAMDRVKDVFIVEEEDAYQGVRELARHGVYVGPSSGVCWSGAQQLARRIGRGRILTFFPDRGELYGADVLKPNVVK